MFLDSGPAGEKITYNGKEYEFLPNVFSGKGIKAITRAIYQSRRELLGPNPSDHELAVCVNTPPTHKEIYHYLSNDPLVIAAALTVCCPQLSDIQQAVQFVDNYPHATNIGVLLASVVSGLDEAGKCPFLSAIKHRNEKFLDDLKQRALAEQQAKEPQPESGETTDQTKVASPA